MTSTPIQSAIATVSGGSDLDAPAMRSAMHQIMAGEATPAQIAGLLVGLSVKGETVEEIVAAATVMRELASGVTGLEGPLTDIVGTGGDGASLFNVSTASAFVAAAGGARIAKHGNRSVSSKSGAADVLETAGVKLELSPAQVREAVDTLNVGFLFAPVHHSAMRHAVLPRKEIGVRTMFNLLGPLTNPAGATRQVLGVFDPRWLRPLAEALAELGGEHVLVIHSDDGLDEFSIAAPTRVAELKDGQVREFTFDPSGVGLAGSLDGLAVANALESLEIIRGALGGQGGPAADIIALNAGAALYVAGRADTLEAGIEQARALLGDGEPLRRLEAYAAWSQSAPSSP
ncbi:anthranilate phosphoribosyltransferase [Wenzhouxiangella sp. XN79A]|uniref:anthranilate phosphoribosyltransferase n=1 Tax=Wenzhouxiangella sp. XN79A TaxID=2724193 RepID=UPI00144AF603|nr:anthranilate phosphoribosyltransferase [Wenzhouxiangella sp. XN79A]NKI34707.1 anthranilate phosphoribosyltransferase [Wenzhouxiangella sp. XN79A]